MVSWFSGWDHLLPDSSLLFHPGAGFPTRPHQYALVAQQAEHPTYPGYDVRFKSRPGSWRWRDTVPDPLRA